MKKSLAIIDLHIAIRTCKPLVVHLLRFMIRTCRVYVVIMKRRAPYMPDNESTS